MEKRPDWRDEASSNNNWPRDGAMLRGEVKSVNGEKWLHAKQVKQKSGEWVDAPLNAYMPFEYSNKHYYLSEEP